MTEILEASTPSDTTIMLRRTFTAPPRLVFAALTEPALLMRWFGARGWHLVVCEVDLRVGGAWRFVSRGPGGVELGHGGVYREIDPPVRLSFTESYDDAWVPGEALVTNELAGLPEGTLLTNTIRYPSREIRDMVLKTPMRRGATEAYERLDETLRKALSDKAKAKS
ncbi:SRPBCC family protein [Allorhizocola rhizosphaerae]|uniref:SRPBCC family protein n=1 Tax=Allorhizocola rhizosphaerae TaxID=1872709 RepID=UPI000E3BD7A1|nr:SRPBCC family protein [Allorhizocola rhizosphaerae]